jgi:hypothetical protein
MRHPVNVIWRTLCQAPLQGLVACVIGFGSEVGSSSTRARKVAGENWLDEGAENNLGTTAIFVRMLSK